MATINLDWIRYQDIIKLLSGINLENVNFEYTIVKEKQKPFNEKGLNVLVRGRILLLFCIEIDYIEKQIRLTYGLKHRRSEKHVFEFVDVENFVNKIKEACEMEIQLNERSDSGDDLSGFFSGSDSDFDGRDDHPYVSDSSDDECTKQKKGRNDELVLEDFSDSELGTKFDAIVQVLSGRLLELEKHLLI